MTKETKDIVGFEMDAFDGVVVTAALNGGPVGDGGAARERVAHVGLLEDGVEAGPGLAVSEKFGGVKVGAAGAVNGLEEPIFDGVSDSDATIKIPGRLARPGLLSELVEKSIVTQVRGPDGQVVGPGDASLSGLPEEFGVGMFGKFIETDVATVNGHGLGMGGEGNDARTVVEFDEADFYIVSGRGGFALGIEAVNFEVIFAMIDDGAGKGKQGSHVFGEAHVFESAGIIFGGEEIIAVFEVEPFADIFESIGIGLADLDGFFGEGEDLFALLVKFIFTQNPGELVRHEIFGEHGIGVEIEGREDGGHGWLRVDG